MGSSPHCGAGAPTVGWSLDELGSSWGVGIKKLGTYAASAAEALSGVADAFESTDEELATALEERPATPAQNGPAPA